MFKTNSEKDRAEPRDYTEADIAAVGDNPEWTPAMFAEAKPFAEVLPALAANIRRSRGPQKAPTKRAINLRLDQDIVDYYKSSGAGWQVRMGEALRKAAGL